MLLAVMKQRHWLAASATNFFMTDSSVSALQVSHN